MPSWPPHLPHGCTCIHIRVDMYRDFLLHSTLSLRITGGWVRERSIWKVLQMVLGRGYQGCMSLCMSLLTKWQPAKRFTKHILADGLLLPITKDRCNSTQQIHKHLSFRSYTESNRKVPWMPASSLPSCRQNSEFLLCCLQLLKGLMCLLVQDVNTPAGVLTGFFKNTFGTWFSIRFRRAYSGILQTEACWTWIVKHLRGSQRFSVYILAALGLRIVPGEWFMAPRGKAWALSKLSEHCVCSNTKLICVSTRFFL